MLLRSVQTPSHPTSLLPLQSTCDQHHGLGGTQLQALNVSESGLVAWLLRAVVSPRGQTSARYWTLVDVLPSQLRIVLQLRLSSFLKPMSSCYPDHYNFWFLHLIALHGCEVVNSFSVLLWFATAARIAWSPKSWADIAQASFNLSGALGCT